MKFSTALESQAKLAELGIDGKVVAIGLRELARDAMRYDAIAAVAAESNDVHASTSSTRPATPIKLVSRVTPVNDAHAELLAAAEADAGGPLDGATIARLETLALRLGDGPSFADCSDRREADQRIREHKRAGGK